MHTTAPDMRDRTHAYVLPVLDERPGPVFDPRSHYAETFWLPILGPSTMWLLRKFADRFDSQPDGFTLDVLEMSRALGIASNGGRNNSFHRSVERVIRFKMGRPVDDQTIAVRRSMPALHAAQIRRLPPRLANLHDETIRQHKQTSEEDLRRSENVALTLLQLGDSPDLVEQQLITWGIDSHLSKAAVDVAWATKARQDSAAAQQDRVSY